MTEQYAIKCSSAHTIQYWTGKGWTAEPAKALWKRRWTQYQQMLEFIDRRPPGIPLAYELVKAPVNTAA